MCIFTISDDKLEILIKNIDSLLVAFDGFANDDQVQEVLEMVLPKATELGISVIRTSLDNADEVSLSDTVPSFTRHLVLKLSPLLQFGLSPESVKQLVFFDTEIPTFYSGMMDEDDVAEWIQLLMESDEIELLSGSMLTQVWLEKKFMRTLLEQLSDLIGGTL